MVRSIEWVEDGCRASGTRTDLGPALLISCKEASSTSNNVAPLAEMWSGIGTVLASVQGDHTTAQAATRLNGNKWVARIAGVGWR